MWIHEQFFAIWKRRSRSFVFAFFALGALQTRCVVTDEIEFVDKINNPPEISKFDPAEDTVIPVCDATPESFTVKVWDPDEDDDPQARIYLMENPYTGGEWVRQPPCSSSLDPDHTEDSPGVSRYLNCSVTVYDPSEGDVMLVKVQVADLGYTPSETISEGARTAEAIWVLEATTDPLICDQL